MPDMRDEAGLGDTVADLVPEQLPTAAELQAASEVDAVPVAPVLDDPDDFSFDDFLGGVTPFRRAVRLYSRPDLVAEMDQLAATIIQDKAYGATDPVQAFNAVREQFYASGRWFVLEGRSADWVEETRKRLVAERGYTVDERGVLSDGPDREQVLEAITHEMLRLQLVTPSNATVEGMAALAAKVPGEYRKLLACQAFVNSTLPENSKVLTVDFSRAPSAGTGD